MKILSKGVKVDVTEEHVSVDLSLNIKYGYNIPEVSERVQERVKSAIENMTGLTVLDVKVKIGRSQYGRRQIIKKHNRKNKNRGKVLFGSRLSSCSCFLNSVIKI